MKIVFFGSDEFSISALRACIDSQHEICLVVTTPAQKQGRGLKFVETPVKLFSEEKNLKSIAPDDLKSEVVLEQIKSLEPDLYVVSSYGKYIPSKYLSIPKVAPLNIHPSLVPKYRGSGPIQWAILNGDLETGVSIIEVAKQLDGGDVFQQVKIPIDQHDDHPSLRAKLGHLSYDLLLKILKSNLSKDSLPRTKQDDTKAVYARKLTKDDGHVKFTETAASIEQKVRALRPWPGTFVTWQGQRIALLNVALHPEHHFETPGTLLEITPDQSMIVSANNGTLRIKEVQPAGKKAMTAGAFANGKRLKPSFVFITE